MNDANAFYCIERLHNIITLYKKYGEVEISYSYSKAEE